MIEIKWNPTHHFLRWFSAFFFLFFTAIGTIRYYQGDESVANVLWCISLLGLVGLAVPALMRYVYVTWMVVFFPVGWTVSMVILSAVYYLVVTPLGLIMRLCGHDRLGRRIDPETDSYWTSRTPVTKPGRYFRQF